MCQRLLQAHARNLQQPVLAAETTLTIRERGCRIVLQLPDVREGLAQGLSVAGKADGSHVHVYHAADDVASCPLLSIRQACTKTMI